MNTLTCDELAERLSNLLDVQGHASTPVDAGGEADAVDWFWARSPIDAEVYVQQRLVYALRRLGTPRTVGDPPNDARIALGAHAHLLRLQGGAE